MVSYEILNRRFLINWNLFKYLKTDQMLPGLNFDLLIRLGVTKMVTHKWMPLNPRLNTNMNTCQTMKLKAYLAIAYLS